MRALALGLAVLVLAGCAEAPPDPFPTIAGTAVTAERPGSPMTVALVLEHLLRAGATDPKITTPETDPVKLQGRPGQYTERATFALPGGDPSSDRAERGGVVEIWPTVVAAQERVTFIDSTIRAVPMFGAPYYQYLHGRALVYVSGTIVPAVAERIGSAVAALP